MYKAQFQKAKLLQKTHTSIKVFPFFSLFCAYLTKPTYLSECLLGNK